VIFSAIAEKFLVVAISLPLPSVAAYNGVAAACLTDTHAELTQGSRMAVLGVDKIIVGVRDQNRARQFWSEILGFAVTTDAPYNAEERWVEVTSSDGNITLVLSLDPEYCYRVSDNEQIPNANPFFYANDLEKTYQELSAKGVDFPAKPSKQPWGWWSMFTDSEGNRFALQQRGD
jgi:predicted enzyme related to lactoylglutathione lyase